MIFDLFDGSKRTKRMMVAVLLSLLGIIALSIALPWSVVGHFQSEHVKSQSSTPIGTEIEFPRSEASMTISDLYTDVNEDVLIVRLSDISSHLPYRGDDYDVFIHAPSIDDSYQEMDVIFGRFSTDGDAFLVIPKPSTDVYTVYLMNTNYFGHTNVGNVGNTDSGVEEIQMEEIESSISQALSSYQYSNAEDGQSQTENSYSVDDNFSDIANFRVTTEPALSGDEYQPTQLNAELLNDDDTFNFEAFFNTVFKDAAISQLERTYERLDSDAAPLRNAINDYQQRLDQNPNDTEARNQIDDLSSDLESIEEQQVEIANQINIYNEVTYSDDLFTNLQTQARLVTPVE